MKIDAEGFLVLGGYEKQNFFIEYSKFGLIEINNSAVNQSLEIVRRRIDEVGTKEPTIVRRGNDRILVELPGLTPGMLVTLGEQKILTLNDFADLASDELTGTYDIVNGEKVKIKGYLEDFALNRQEADNLMQFYMNFLLQVNNIKI